MVPKPGGTSGPSGHNPTPEPSETERGNLYLHFTFTLAFWNQRNNSNHRKELKLLWYVSKEISFFSYMCLRIPTLKGRRFRDFPCFFFYLLSQLFPFLKKIFYLFMCVCMHIYTHTHIFQWNIIALNVELISEVQWSKSTICILFPWSVWWSPCPVFVSKAHPFPAFPRVITTTQQTLISG